MDKYSISIEWDIVWQKKEWSNYTCYNINEPWKNYANWKNLVTDDYTVF